jgi:hypothetical protein
MKWVIIKGVRYPISVVSAFAAYYGDNPFLKIRIRNKYHIIYFDNMDYLNIQIRYLINNYPDFVQIGNWYISKKQVMSWAPKGQAVDGSGWEFDNGRFTACGCGTDCYSHWSVRAESIMSVIKRSDNGKSAEVYDIDELKNNWNHWVRTGEILFTPGNGKW